MSNVGDAGGTGNAFFGLAMVEHQQQMAADGRTARDAAQEIGVAGLNVEQIYKQIEHRTKEIERIFAYIGAGMAAFNLVMKSISLGKDIKLPDKIMADVKANFPPEQWEQQFKLRMAQEISARLNPDPKKESTWDRLKSIGMEVGQQGMSSMQHNFQTEKQAAGESARHAAAAKESEFAQVEQFRELVKQQEELTVEMLELSKIFRSKPG